MNNRDQKMTVQSPESFDSSTKSRLGVKLAFLLSLLMLFAIISAGLMNYNKNVDLILSNLQNQLQLAANTIAVSIDGDAYQTLKGKESVNTVEYLTIRTELQKFVDANAYLGFEENNIYTFRRISEDSLEFTVMLQDQYIGNRYPIRPEMLPTIEEKKTSFTGIYEDENGTWVSAYAPIRNSMGTCVGLVEVDFKDNVYLMAVYSEIYDILMFSLLGIAIAIVMAILLSRYIARPIRNISQAVVKFAHGDTDITVPETTGDEIGMLSRAFNYMVAEIREKERVRQRNIELLEAYEQLDAANHSLQEANRLKSEFLGIAAHDLKNPLQVIQGFAESIMLLKTSNPDVVKSGRKIYNASNRMLKIISQLLDIAAMESGNLVLKKQMTDIGDLAYTVAMQQENLAAKKNQSLEINVEENCFARVDRDRIHEVFENLLSNAIKFSEDGQEIHLTVASIATGQPGNKGIRISIRDNGPGLTDDDMKKLFGKFMRLSAQPTAGEGSTGLGLSVVKKLVELHGGTVWADSKGKNKGTTFWVELPVEASDV